MGNSESLVEVGLAAFEEKWPRSEETKSLGEAARVLQSLLGRSGDIDACRRLQEASSSCEVARALALRVLLEAAEEAGRVVLTSSLKGEVQEAGSGAREKQDRLVYATRAWTGGLLEQLEARARVLSWVDLRHYEDPAVGVEEALLRLEHLTHLDVSGTTLFAAPETAEALVAFACASGLRHLNLRSAFVSGPLIVSSVGLFALRSLNVENVEIPEESFRHFARALPDSSLRELWISNTAQGPANQGLQKMYRAVPHSRLERLVSRTNPDADLESARALLSSPHLWHLDCRRTPNGGHWVKALEEMLPKNHVLYSLWLLVPQPGRVFLAALQCESLGILVMSTITNSSSMEYGSLRDNCSLFYVQPPDKDPTSLVSQQLKRNQEISKRARLSVLFLLTMHRHHRLDCGQHLASLPHDILRMVARHLWNSRRHPAWRRTAK